jgi:hypothetical protein
MSATLKIVQPYNITVFLSFFSPIILASSFVISSFVFQNFKGFIYLGFIIAMSVLRNYTYMLYGSTEMINDNTVCSTVQYSKYGNAAFSSFIFGFSIMYICLPMFANNAVNYSVFTGLLSYFAIDTFLKTYGTGCVQFKDVFFNTLAGLLSSALIVTLMYSGGSSKFLFFNEVSSNKESCSRPKNETFKCKVFKNGELIGNI